MIFRAALILCLTLGILLPKLSGVLVQILPNVDQFVLCSGSGMEVITLGPDGTPIDIEPHGDDRCVTASPDTGQMQQPAFWQALARSWQAPFVATPSPVTTQILYLKRLPGQAPPVTV